MTVDHCPHMNTKTRNCSAIREALELAEDVLSRAPFSTAIWPNGMHPNEGIKKIREALAMTSTQREGK